MRTLKLAVTVLVMAGAVSLILGGAASGQELARIGGFEHGAIFGAAVSGTDAYVGNGYFLQKLDIGDPSDITLVEELRMDGAPGVIELADNLAYVLTYPGELRIVDVGGAGPLAEVGSYVPGTAARNFTLAGDTAYLVGDGGLVVLDLLDPVAPDSVGSLALNHPFDVKATGTILYVFDEDGVHVVDATNAAAPTVVTSFEYVPKEFGSPGALCIHGDRLYVVYEDGVRGLDITSPQNPVPQGRAHTSLGGMEIGASGDFVYVPTGAGISVFNFTMPDIPSWAGTFGFGRDEHHGGALVVDGVTAFYASRYHGLSILDVTDPYGVTELGRYEVPGHFGHLDREGDLAAVGGFPHIMLLDVSDPGTPDTLSTLPAPAFSDRMERLVLEGNALYLLWEYDLKIFDVSNPLSPSLTYEYNSSRRLFDLTVVPENDLVVISRDQSFLYLDISEPQSPVMMVQGPNSYLPDNVLVHNDYIYVFNWINVRAVSLATPDSPCAVFALPSPYSDMNGFAVDEVNDILFLGLRLGHVIAVDISEPCNPVELGRTSVPAEVEDIAVRRGTLGEPGLLVLNKIDDETGSVVFFDFSNRADFVEVARYDGILQPEEMVLQDDEILVTTGPLGFQVLQGDTFVPVTLAHLGAERRGGEVVVRWELARADDRSSFFVYRETGDGALERLHDSPLRGGTRFELVDPAAPSGETVYRLEELDAGGGRRWLGSITVAAVGELARRPVLHPNTPNPFAPRTTIGFDLPAAGPVRLAVYDISGGQVKVLLDGPQGAGRRQVEWDGRDDAGRLASSGVYFIELRAAGETQRRKVVLAR